MTTPATASSPAAVIARGRRAIPTKRRKPAAWLLASALAACTQQNLIPIGDLPSAAPVPANGTTGNSPSNGPRVVTPPSALAGSQAGTAGVTGQSDGGSPAGDGGAPASTAGTAAVSPNLDAGETRDDDEEGDDDARRDAGSADDS
jgi:hypothetical protein